MAINPIAISIFGFDIYWYGLVYVFSFLFAYFFILHFRKEFNLEKKFVEDLFFYTMIASVLGGRLGYIIFYDLLNYLSNPLEIFAVWNGGMSIHGGLIGGALSLLYFSKKNKVPFLKLSDLIVIPISLGVAFGRLANFVNQELVGTITDSKIGVVFPLHDENFRWPTTLFEGLKNLVTFNVLFFIFTFKKLKRGTLTAIFLILYSFGRFFIDFLREHTLTLYIISMGQFLSLIGGLVGVYILFYINKKN